MTHSLHAIFEERWPTLSHDPRIGTALREWKGTPDGYRFQADGRTLVSPNRPEAEARRQIDKMLPEAAGKDCVLVGHGLGHTCAELLSRGLRSLKLLAPDRALLAEALRNWSQPELLADERFQILAPDQVDAALPEHVEYLELPSWRKAMPERLANLRVKLNRCGSDQLRLRILVVEPIYGGSLPMARSAARALESCGHEVRSLDFSRMEGARDAFAQFGDTHPGGNMIAGEFTRLLARMISIECRHYKPDLVLAMAQSPAIPAVMQELGSAGIRTAFWFVEDYQLLEYWKGIHGAFDFFLTIQKGEFHKRLAEISPRPVRYLPVCADTSFYKPVDWSLADSAPIISFVGAGYHNRERSFLRLLDLPFKVWGSDWRRQSPVYGLLQNEGHRTEVELNRQIFSNSRINLNLHSSSYHDGVDPFGDFVNPRTLEIAACGGFQLCDTRLHLAEMLEPGREIVTFSDTDEMRTLCEEWLEKPEEAKLIAHAGRVRVQTEHGYEHRMKELLELFLLEGEDAFPHARKRGNLSGMDSDPLLAEWLKLHGLTADADLDQALITIRQSEAKLDETGRLLLYLGELRDWAREKGVERAYDRVR